MGHVHLGAYARYPAGEKWFTSGNLGIKLRRKDHTREMKKELLKSGGESGIVGHRVELHKSRNQD